MERILARGIEQASDLDVLNSLSQPNRVFAIYDVLNGRDLAMGSGFAYPAEDEVILRNFGVLTADAQRDLALCLRSRGIDHELGLLNQLPVERDDFVFDRYGTHLVPPLGTDRAKMWDATSTREGFVYMVSGESWEETWDQLQKYDYGRATVLLPELITAAGTPPPLIHSAKARAEQAVAATLDFSKEQAEATFILGSPHFPTTSEKPLNSAYIIRNGQVIDMAVKQFLSYSEGQSFEVPNFQRHSPATVLGDIAVLICSDLLGIRVAKWSNWGYIADHVRTLLVAACWSIPGSPNFYSEVPRDPDKASTYFLRALQSVCDNALRVEPNVERIIICDRALPALITQGGFHANRPLSAVKYRSPRLKARAVVDTNFKG